MTEILFFWLAIGCYVASSIAYIGGLVFSRDRLRRAGAFLALGGLFLHTLSLGVRWSLAGHGPYISTFEIVSSSAWTAVLFFLIFEWRIKWFVNLGAVVMPLSFVMMGAALLGSTEARTLPPSLRSAWLVVHVIFAKLAVAAMFIAVAMAVFYLLKTGGKTSAMGFLARLPSPAVLDDWSYRLVALGFITITIMIITGAIWANNAWGSYWSWDPTQTWSLVAWIVYGLYLHGRRTFRWKGKISAWYVIFALIVLVLTIFVLPYFIKSIHSSYMVG